MNLNDVMDQVAARLKTIPNLRVRSHPADSIEPPTAIVSLPAITYDATYGRGMDRFELPVIVAVGKVVDRSARIAVAEYVAGSGARSVKQVLESGPYTAFDVLRVITAEFDVITFGTVEYLSATFTLDIAGQGA